MSKNKLNIYNLYYIDLYTVKSKEGYITLQRLDNMIRRDGDWKEKKICYSYRFSPDMSVLNRRKIIVEKPKFTLLRNPKQLTEFLTGEQFDCVKMGNLGMESSHEELDTFAFLNYGYNLTSPTSEELYKYMEEHIDKEEYRKELINLKTKSKADHMKTLHQEEYDRYLKEILPERTLLLDTLFDQYKCSINVKRACLEVIKSNTFMKQSTIEDLLLNLRNKYPSFNDEEYSTMVLIILRIQSKTGVNDKKYLKAI